MSQYRLHIDIPLGADEENAIAAATQIVTWYFADIDARNKLQTLTLDNVDLEEINYRLGNDDDRQKSNYLDKNENGHVSNKKIRISISG